MESVLMYEVGTAFGAPVLLVEVVGFVAGAWCVWLAARRNPWSWPIGLVQVVAYLWLFAEYGLYADSALQGIYILLGLWGWALWLGSRSAAESTVPVRQTPAAAWAEMVAAVILGTVAVRWVLLEYTSSNVAFADALTTVLSLTATYAMARRFVECWWIWIVADLIYIPLYAYKELYLTALLYLVFLGLCIAGLVQWRTAARPVHGPQAMVEQSA